MHLLTEPVPGRYGFHDLLRAYAIDRVEARETVPDRDAARDRVLAWYLWTATAAARHLSPHRRHVDLDGPPPAPDLPPFDTDTARFWLETERVNLVAAVDAASRVGAHDIAWKLPLTLWDLFNTRGYWADWIACLRIGLTSARHVSNRAAEGWLLNHLGVALSTSGRTTEAIDSLRQAVDLRRRMGDRRGEGAALGNLGRGYAETGRLPEALTCLTQALPILMETNRHAAGVCLCTLSSVHRHRGEFAGAMTNARRAVEFFQEIGDEREESGARTHLALASLGLGRAAEAVDHATRAVELAAASGDRLGEVEGQLALAQAHEDLGSTAEARRLRRAAYAILRDCEDPRAAELLDEIEASAGVLL
jgi:tetratricopeptide (TPR) repeat protein